MAALISPKFSRIFFPCERFANTIVFSSLFLFSVALFAQENKEPVVQLVMEPAMPKYPYDEKTVIQIKESLKAIHEFTLMELYFGNNTSYIPCISVNLNLKTGKEIDSTYIRTIQEKIFSCFPNDPYTTTLMYVNGKPFLLVGASKQYSQIIYYHVDSVKSKAKEVLPDIQRLHSNTDSKAHKIERGYLGLKLSERTSISYFELWLQSSDESGNVYFSRYKPAFKSGTYKSKSALQKAIPLTKQKYGFSATIEEVIYPPKSTANKYLYYLTNSGDLIEKSLFYVGEHTERYTEYFLKVF